MATMPKLVLSPKPYTEFEVESCELSSPKGNRNKNRSLVIHTIPTNANHLLLVALLEHLCSLYIRNPDSKDKLFKLLCRQLAKMEIMSPLCGLDELSTVRTQYRLNFAKLLQACVAHLNLKSQLALPSCQDPVSRFTDNRLPSWHQPSLDLSQCMNFHTSRYRDEYIEIDTLGKGAYGSVYKVKHKLDDSYYAVKKILFQDNTPAVWSKTLREVKHLADLNHPSIIRYYTAWLEYDLPLFNMQETHHKIQKDNNLPEVAYPNENTKDSIFDKASSQSSGSSIVFEDASASSTPNKSNIKCWDQYNQKDSGSGKSSLKKMQTPRSTSYSESVLLDHCHVVLHIQMELCNETLQDWLTTRNGRVQDSKDVYDVVDKNINTYILKEVLHGVHYLHSNNLIHRDLKPSNIFLNAIQDTGRMSVKIGDFGLIRHNIKSNGNTTQPVTPLTPAPGLLEEPQLDMSGVVLTGGVGTTIYASPEQLAGAQYDSKSDMYSIGLILFEMFQPFYTSMERTKILTDLRQSSIPTEFTERWPTLSKAVKELMDLDPDKRPTASTVLKGPLFTSDKAEVTKKLQAELDEKNQLLRSYASRIQELEMLLTQRDNEMKQLRMLLDPKADTNTSR